MKINRNMLIKILLVALIGALLIWVNYRYIDLSPERIRDLVNQAGWFAPLLYILIYTLRPLILFPASILSLAGGLIFGAFTGTLLIVIGATLGAVLSFIVADKLGKNIAGKEKSGHGKKLQMQLEQNGLIYVLLVRLIPLFNFDMISYIAGVSKVKLKDFALGTLVGIIPGAFAYSFLGASFAEGDGTLIFVAVSLFIAISVIPLVLWKRYQKNRKIPAEEREI